MEPVPVSKSAPSPNMSAARSPALRTLALAVVTGLVSVPVRGQISVVQVAGNTTGNPLSRPVYLTSAPQDFRRAFIIEKQGRIRVLDITSPEPTLQADTAPFLDIRSLIPTLAAGNNGNQDERGLLGLAFHPGYMSNGKFYVYYTTLPVANLPNSAANFQNVVEYTNRNPQTLTPSPLSNIADPTSARIIMQIPDPQSNHNGGWMAFGPDGFLYVVCGDGGGAGDDEPGHTTTIGNGQDTGTPMGKILRIDVNVTAAPPQGPFVPGAIASYGIPADNPTIAAPPLASGSRREIWAYGLRNPWRCSFDRDTGDLWIADVGQNNWEEINFQPALTASNLATVAGRNYGWRCWEGTTLFSTSGGTCPASFDSPGLTAPAGVYIHAATLPGTIPPRAFTNILGTCSITGGYVYRGCRIPELQGRYLFTDYCSGRIWSTTLDGSGVATQPIVHSDGTPNIYSGSAQTTPPISAMSRPTTSLVSFGEDAYGELYLVDQPNARIFKIVRSAPGTIVNANCDITLDGSITVQDIFSFLAAYFSPGLGADFNRDGSVSVQDVFDFLECFFSGCTAA